MGIEASRDVIRITVDLSGSPKQAWPLLAEKPRIATWWGDHVDLQARSGGKLLETWSDGSREVITSDKVTRCDPPFPLEMTWTDDDWPGDTRVAFHLAERGGCTRLVLDHSGWSVHPASEWQALIEGHARGWSQYLILLANSHGAGTTAHGTGALIEGRPTQSDAARCSGATWATGQDPGATGGEFASSIIPGAPCRARDRGRAPERG